MPSFQRVLRFSCMIKLRLVPSIRFVTRLTLTTVATVVSVITAMAGDAFRIQLFTMELSAMAYITFHFLVFAIQPIFRVPIVIKADTIPACFRMTFIAP